MAVPGHVEYDERVAVDGEGIHKTGAPRLGGSDCKIAVIEEGVEESRLANIGTTEKDNLWKGRMVSERGLDMEIGETGTGQCNDVERFLTPQERFQTPYF